MRGTAGCSADIQQNAFGRKKPIAVSRTTNALYGLLVTKRKIQPGMENCAAFPGCRVANDHVPGQFIESRLTTALSQLRGL